MRMVWLAVWIFLSAAAHGQNWPGFRGHRADGIGNGRTATTWSIDPRRNVLFKVAVPGLAHSSPVIWGDRIFLTTAVSSGGDPKLRVGLYGDITPVENEPPQSWRVLAYDRGSGKLLWEQVAHEGVPKTKRHPKSTHANPTPATDGQRVVAFFGSQGLYCYDLSGKLLWKRSFGVLDSGFFQAPDAQWGFASSPILYDDRVIVQADVLGESFLEALSVEDGRTIWRTKRSDVPTWSTPNVLETADGAQILVNGWKHIGGYDARTGQELWKLEGGGDIPVPTPQVAHDLIFITNAHGSGSPIFAVRAGARGSIAPGGQTAPSV